MPKADRKSIEGIQFVHMAIPDMALNETDTSYTVKEGIELPYPLAVAVDSDEQAKELSKKNKNVPMVCNSVVYINGKSAGSLKSTYLIEVRDGIEAAKAIRLDPNALPCIDKAELEMIETYIRQLRISMFLTNSKNTKALEAAPIYNMRL
ncbi:MAG TPA: hypothetical protein VL944_03155 [Candidatus Acidoferrum sp.]|nr:hypothetical protein [Candidatus Acidoferrum sp.]